MMCGQVKQESLFNIFSIKWLMRYLKYQLFLQQMFRLIQMFQISSVLATHPRMNRSSNTDGIDQTVGMPSLSWYI